MDAIHGAGHLSGWLAVLLLGSVCALGGPVHAVGTGPAVDLEPASGPPGTDFAVSATEFGACGRPTVLRDFLVDGTQVAPRSLETAPQETAPTVDFLFDKTVQATASLADGTATVTLSVPEAAEPREHDVEARCADDTTLSASSTFVVTVPVEPPVVVPNLVGSTLDEAAETLAADGLRLGERSGDGELVEEQTPQAGSEVERGTTVDVRTGTAPQPEPVVVPNLIDLPLERAEVEVQAAGLTLDAVLGSGELVRDQSPAPGTSVQPGTGVRVTLGAPAPETVVVPDLRGKEINEVPRILSQRDLVLADVAGDGEIVRDQNPAPGTRTLPGSAVSVSVEPAVPPAQMVAVPDLRGSTVEEARQQLEPLGLALLTESSGDAEVSAQSPLPLTLVAQGSGVTVTTSSPFPWEVVLLLTLALALLLGSALPRLRERRRSRQQVRRQLRVVAARPIFEATTEVTPESPDEFECVVRIEPYPDKGTHVVEEVHA
jgi:beta-lactam-binding protein with PASTA domain